MREFAVMCSYLALALVVFEWSGFDRYILGGDLGWPLSFSKFLHFSKYFWDGSVNEGYSASRQLSSIFPYAVFGRIIELARVSGPFVQKIIYFISFAFSGMGMYLLARFYKISPASSFVSGLFYMFSSYAAIIAWVPSYGLTFPFYSFLPMGLYFFLGFLNNFTSVRFLYLIGLSFLFLGASYSNPVFFITYIILTFGLFLYHSFMSSNRIRLVKGYAVFITLLVLANSFWLIPFVSDLRNQYDYASNDVAGLMSDMDTIRLNSLKIHDSFIDTGFWALTVNYSGESYYDWQEMSKAPIYIIANFFLLIVGLLSIFNLNKEKKEYHFFLWVFLFGILLNSGFSSGGFFEINRLFFSFDYAARAFRSVYLKLGILLVFPFSLLLGMAIDRINKYGKLVFCSCFIAIIINGAPFFNSQIIKKTDGKLISSSNVKIPDDYHSLKNAKISNLDSRFLSLPLPRSYNLNLRWETGTFQGADFLRFFLDRPLIYMNDGKANIKNISEAIVKNDNGSLLRILSLLNVKYVFEHKDVAFYDKDSYLTPGSVDFSGANNILSTNSFDVKELDGNLFAPHFFSALVAIVSNRDETNLLKFVSSPDWQIRSAVFFASQNKGKDAALEQIDNQSSDARSSSSSIAPTSSAAPTVPTSSAAPTLPTSSALRAPSPYQGEGDNVMLPTIEFKKIDPTKYRVRVHGASGVFPLVFSESFHDGWKAYLASPERGLDSRRSLSAALADGNDTVENYKILDGNSDDQATQSELQDYIQKGWVSDLGDGKEKTIDHQKWVDGKEQFDYAEKYSIDFISKNFQGTIQNDNLPAGHFWETWFRKPVVDDGAHLTANGYANAWVVDMNLICSATSTSPTSSAAPSSPSAPAYRQAGSPRAGEGDVRCIKNPDGTYDFELVVEFWPQRLFYIGLGISGLTLLGCIAYLGYDYRKRKKSKRQAAELKSRM